MTTALGNQSSIGHLGGASPAPRPKWLPPLLLAVATVAVGPFGVARASMTARPASATSICATGFYLDYSPEGSYCYSKLWPDGSHPQPITVPPGETEMTVTAYGASGGDGASWHIGNSETGEGSNSGQGGWEEPPFSDVTATLPVDPGEQLTVDVGEAGGSATRFSGGAGGWPGGGNGGVGAGGGGGGTFVFGAGNKLLLAAGGGGGGGYAVWCWNDGCWEPWGLSGMCQRYPNSCTPSALADGTNAGRSNPGRVTVFGKGGDGATDGTGPASSPTSVGTGGDGDTDPGHASGGGGGSGYYGGGGASAGTEPGRQGYLEVGGGGGSGSAYVAPGATDVQWANVFWWGDGYATFQYPAGTPITGTVITPDGTPVPGVSVNLTGTGPQGRPISASTVTGQDGSYTFTELPGDYTVTPEVPGNELEYYNQAYEFEPVGCPGTSDQGACTGISVVEGQPQSVNFVFGCGVQGLELASVGPLGPGPHGAPIDNEVLLHGRGFCAQMTVEFQNSGAVATVLDTSDLDILDHGQTATVTVPRLATSGFVTLGYGGRKALLANVKIDSFRNVNGFNFPNPAGITNPEQFEHVFGVANTTVTEVYNTCPPGYCPKTVQRLTPMANAVYLRDAPGLLNGVCFGMVLGSERLSGEGDLTPSSIGEGADDVWDLPDDSNVQSFINEQQWTDSSEELEAIRAQTVNSPKSGAQLLGEVTSELGGAFSAGTRGAIIVLEHQSAEGNEGHALLAYDVQQSPTGSGYIYAYDPNIPFLGATELQPDGVQHEIRTGASIISVARDGSWRYQGAFQPPWTGDSTEIGVVPYSDIMSAINAGLHYFPLGPGQKVGVQLAPGTLLTSLVANGQTVSPESGGAGVLPDPTDEGDGSPQFDFIGPQGTYDETLTSGGNVGATWQAEGWQASLSASPGTDAATLDSTDATVSIGSVPGHKSSATMGLSVQRLAPDHGMDTATVSGQLGEGTVSLSFSPAGTLLISRSGQGGATYDVAVTTEAQQEPEQVFSTHVPLNAGETATVDLDNWPVLYNSSGRATLSNDGHTAVLHLANQAQPPLRPQVGQLARSGNSLDVGLSLPQLPKGSTQELIISYLDGRKLLTQVTSASLGDAQSRTDNLAFRIPASIGTGATATAYLLTQLGGGSAAVLSNWRSVPL